MANDERKVVTVDEALIHSMMAGDVPRALPRSEQPQEDEPVADPGRQEEAAAVQRPRRRKEQKGYADIFLDKLAPMPRKHTYISIAMYDDLSELLPVIARGVSIPNFLENLLRHHFETYRDEINELYETKTRKRY